MKLFKGQSGKRTCFLEFYLPLLEKEINGAVVFGVDLFSKKDELQIVSLNTSFTSITGYELPDLFGESPKNFLKRIFQWKEKFSLDEITTSFYLQKQFLTKKGELRWAKLNWTPVISDSGQLVHLILRIADITDEENARKEEKRVYHETRYLSLHDPLTGLLNRYAAEQYWNGLCKNRRKDHIIDTATILMVDVDKFKEINDAYGHFKGDVCLQTVADIIAGIIRFEEVFRWGGDEFLIIMANAKEDVAESKINKIKENVKSFVFERDDLCNIKLSVSIGFSVETNLGELNKTLGEAIHPADLRMYRDKEDGRKD